ncbi:MAG: tRNA-dihydrouridine synthase family protein [Bacteroidaceae bacterium]|nr:tRNA-dihydrouridine synthase family protein [Bacteroidaceae bacterium]
MSMPIHFAPLQGYTDDAYRRIHHQLIGGICTYYTPFVRMEAGGVRSKDMRDIRPEFNEGVPVVPQIIAKSMKEFEYLVGIVEEKGYIRIDLNLGCPFPMQAKHGRGSGLLAHTDIVADMAQSIASKKHLQFSVKMRLGWEDADEWRPVLDILNETPLQQITLHPRIGTQQYKGALDMQAFEACYQACKHPLVYNGDITSVADIHRIEQAYPQLAGIMIGRGLLARPSLAIEYASGKEQTWEERRATLLEMHSQLQAHYEPILNSEAQLHNKLRTFWEYMENELGRKPYKKIMKSGNLRNYLKAVREL